MAVSMQPLLETLLSTSWPPPRPLSTVYFMSNFSIYSTLQSRWLNPTSPPTGQSATVEA